MRRVLRRLGRPLLGALIGLVLLEGGLRVAGFLTKRADNERIASLEGAVGGEDRPSLLCLGACYTAGIGSPPNLSYPALLERMWGERHPDNPIRVYNGGQRARGIDYFAERIDALLATYQPSVLVLNVNDRILYRIDDIVAARRRPALPLWGHDLLADLRVYRVVNLLFSPPTRRSALEEIFPDAPHAGPSERGLASGERRERIARERAERDPRDPQAWRTLAQACSDQAAMECTIEANGHVLELNPSEWDAMRRIAVARAMARNYHAARVSFGEAGRIAGGTEAVRERVRERESQLAAEPNHFNGTWATGLEELGTYAAMLGDWTGAADHARRLVLEHPGVLHANDLLEFYTAAQLAEAANQDLPLAAPAAADSLYRKYRADLDDSERRYGVYGTDGTASGEGEPLLLDVLQANLGRIVEAAEARGVRVVVEDFASAPEQRAAIRALCEAYDLPLVPLQEAFDASPDRQSLMHPTLAMRLNAEGNRFLAEQVYTVLEEEHVFDK